MNNVRRNVVFVGLTKNQERLIKEDGYKWDKFPKLIFEDTLEKGLKHQGFMIVIKSLNMPDDFLDFDINNRHLFRNYDKVVYCIEHYRYIPNNVLRKMSKIAFEPFNYLYNFNPHYLVSLLKNYLKESNTKKTSKRLRNIENLNKYLKGKRKVTTEEIMNNFHVSSKWVVRYMNDVNQKYQNIGYEFINKYWYIVKNK